MEECDRKDLEVNPSSATEGEALSHGDNHGIAVSDSFTLIEERSSGLANEATCLEPLGTVALVDAKAMGMADKNEQIDQTPKLVETQEPERSTKNGKFNLRKSLAWDSAFFTSDGVLDAEELSTMIEGGEKGVKHHLPGIEEEVYRSMESISTLESDNLTLECLEAELFEDIRASIQKSSRPSNVISSGIKVSSGKNEPQAKVGTCEYFHTTSKKVDLDSGKRPAARTIKDQTSSVPQPKIINRLNSTSTLTSKRASLSTNLAKNVTQKANQAAKTNSTQGSKINGVINPRRAVPKPSLSSKPSSLTSTGSKIDPTRPSSSCGSSSSSSGNDATFSRKKADLKTKLKPGLIPKTPSKISVKSNKAPIANCRISSSISPASSISEWSSESSSSNSNVNRRSLSRGSVDISVDGVESGLNIRPVGRNLDRNGNGSVVESLSQTVSVSRPPVVQPTGLRMPSPKIGFFDGGKSGIRTPNGNTRSQSRGLTSLPKPGPTHHNSPTGSNAPKSAKLPSPKTISTHSNLKQTQKNASKLSQEQSNTKSKPSSASKVIKSSILTSEVSNQKDETKIIDLNIYKNKESDLENDEMENKVDKWVVDCSRTPLAVKNSGMVMEVSEKTANFPFMESELKENSEVV